MITVDANIYISAFQFGGKPATLIEMAESGEIEVATSRAILDEVIRVLHDKFEWREPDLKALRYVLETIAIQHSPVEVFSAVEDEPDNRILECAVESGSTHIVTGDKDLLRLGSFRGIPILRVAEFLSNHGFGA